MMARKKGFTLVELTVVIVILGIVGAAVITRYARYTREARIAALNGLAGAIRSSVVLVQSRYIATRATTSPVRVQDGTTVVVRTTGAAAGIPRSTAGGINNAVNVGGTFTYTAGGATGTFNFRTPIPGCNVTYTAATGRATVNQGTC